jgi:hypothetical protein
LVLDSLVGGIQVLVLVGCTVRRVGVVGLPLLVF